MFRRWRRRLPLQAGCAPRIWPSDATESQRPQKINQRKQISDPKNRCPGGGEDVEQLKLRRIGVVTPWHSEITQNELRKECEIEPDESDHGGEFAGELRIQAPGNFRQPIMQAAHEGHHHSADHDVMKMRDDEVTIMDVNIDRECGEKKSGHSADCKKPDKPERVKHWRLK